VRQLLIRELLYADDDTSVATSTPTLQNLCSSFDRVCAEFNNTSSLSKTVLLSQGPSSSSKISINGAVLPSVEKLYCQGSTVANTNSLKSELNIRKGKFVHVFGKMATSPPDLKPRCTWPVFSGDSRIIKVEVHCGAKVKSRNINVYLALWFFIVLKIKLLRLTLTNPT